MVTDYKLDTEMVHTLLSDWLLPHWLTAQKGTDQTLMQVDLLVSDSSCEMTEAVLCVGIFGLLVLAGFSKVITIPVKSPSPSSSLAAKIAAIDFLTLSHGLPLESC